MPLIVLWDIDHTLIENAGVSKEIYSAAYTELAGKPPLRPARTEGRTDRRILADMFRDHDAEPPTWECVLPALERAGAGRETDLRTRGHELPGARAALKAVAAERGIVSSVLTGNIAANARVKLGAFGLDALLDMAVGGYGADSENRADLVGCARQRVLAAYDLPSRTPVVLVGDTPRDVEAALASGSGVVAVASGTDSAEDLRHAGAETVLPDLLELPTLMHYLYDRNGA
ncbi:HAD family hydrolase [Streptomyces sp. NPDC054863]